MSDRGEFYLLCPVRRGFQGAEETRTYKTLNGARKSALRWLASDGAPNAIEILNSDRVSIETVVTNPFAEEA